jgi:hypothetical protein
VMTVWQRLEYGTHILLNNRSSSLSIHDQSYSGLTSAHTRICGGYD